MTLRPHGKVLTKVLCCSDSTPATGLHLKHLSSTNPRWSHKPKQQHHQHHLRRTRTPRRLLPLRARNGPRPLFCARGLERNNHYLGLYYTHTPWTTWTWMIDPERRLGLGGRAEDGNSVSNRPVRTRNQVLGLHHRHHLQKLLPLRRV